MALGAIACFGVAAAAFAASPEPGATYTGKASQKFVKASDNHESFTVSKNGKSMVKWSFESTGSCTGDGRTDLFDNNGGERPVPIRNGAFKATHTFQGSLGGYNGTFTVTYKGHFKDARTALTTVTEAFVAGGAGQPLGYSCHTRATFTATAPPMVGRGGGSAS